MTAALRSYPIPANDPPRIRTLNALALAGRRRDPFFDHVTDMAKDIFATPIAYVSLMGEEDQTFLHCNGADAEGTPREASLCAFTVAARKTIVLHDTWLDPRSAGHPAVVDGYHIRFSASAPVILSSGFCVGTLCAVDMVPHEAPTEAQVAALDRLAAMVARFYEVPFEPDPARGAELRRIAEEAQAEFLALVGHELRTPLNGICGLAPLIEPADEDGAEIQDAIVNSADLLHRVVDSILFFTELSSGDIELDEGWLDLSGTLDAAVAAQRAQIRLAGKTCDISDIPAGIVLRGDREKLELALSCLVANVVAHGGRAARVSVAKTEGAPLEIEIADDGEGIAADRQRRIWEAFGTGQSVRTRQADGIGLGLPLARKLIELHGGDLELASSDPGLVARLRLPAWRMEGAPGGP